MDTYAALHSSDVTREARGVVGEARGVTGEARGMAGEAKVWQGKLGVCVATSAKAPKRGS